MISRNAQLVQRAEARQRAPEPSRKSDAIGAGGAAQANAEAASQPVNAKLTALTVSAVAVASLPAAASSAWERRFVNDALTPVFGAVVVNGGAVAVPVFSDGTDWRVG